MQEKQDSNLIHLQVERALDELRRQQGVNITHGASSLGHTPAEFVSAAEYAARGASARLLVTAARAKSLGLPPRDTSIETAALSLEQLHAIADPTAPQTALPALTAHPADETASLALRLAKFASLLPALLQTPAIPGAHALTTADIGHYITHPLIGLEQAAQAQLPLKAAPDTRIASFRARHGVSVHLALIVGQPENQSAPLVRVHSSCVTGDILGSLRCDCGDQLQQALAAIAAEGSGVLLYLHQEGRGIGLINKLRAYQLQQQGMDTYEANLLLGYDEDERDFSLAAAMLKALGISAIRLLTNNPQKLEKLEKAGIAVQARVPLVAQPHAHNAAYLAAKANKSGHLF